MLAGAWLATHWLLRESGVWRDRNTEEVREAQRHADYAYRLAVEPPAAKELRLFGLADWTVERFRSSGSRLFELQWQATRLRERPVAWSLLLVLAANIVVFWSLAIAAADGTLPLDRVVTYATRRHHHQHDRLRRAVVGARRRRRARRGDASPRGGDGPRRFAGPRHPAGRRHAGARGPLSQRHLRLPGRGRAGARRASTSRSPPGRRWPSSARTAPARRRWPSCSAGSTTPRPAPSRSTALTSASSTSMPGGRGWRRCSRTSSGSSCRCATTWRPPARRTTSIRAALADAGAAGLAELDTVLARGYEGGTELSGGQWQRVALARALCAVRLGAGVVLLDEPTAQLDVRGEAEIFDRILAATRHTTTILISHRFSTVRHADRICVLEGGRVVELGTHDELMAAGGRYRTMFDLQASRFGSDGDRGGRGDLRCPQRDDLPPRCRPCGGRSKRGYEAEPRLLVVAFGLSLLAALPDALLALWLKLLADGVLAHNRGLVLAAAVGLGALGHRDVVPARGQRSHAAPVSATA